MLQEYLFVSIFYEESTRTRISFELGNFTLGMGGSSTTNARQVSSVAKGETFPDTIRMLCGYRPDLIVLRHPDEGSATEAARISDRWGYHVPIINAGDGKGQHPTQALTDVFTIREKLGRLSNLHVAVVGDLLNGRTTHSLVFLLAKYPGIRFTFVSPPELRMKEGILTHLAEHKVPYMETDDISLALLDADVVYMTRVQWERVHRRTAGVHGTLMHIFGMPKRSLKKHRLMKQASKCALTYANANTMQEGAMIMHPLPRLSEIHPDVDTLRQAYYFQQAENGLAVRIALTLYVLKMEHLLTNIPA
jgi:aspartate carbamoyltransferase catalytic subunit